MGTVPATGTEVSMGRISVVLGLAATAGEVQVGLNSTLGVNRSKLSGSVAQNANIAASGTTKEGTDFGGMSSSFTY